MKKDQSLVINLCPTGMIPTKNLTPHVPVHPKEIIEQVHECYEIGITIAHLHARDHSEKPTWKKSVYQEIFEGVRKHCPDLIICGSTSGRNFPEFEKRSEVIELKPDMCSLTLSSLNFVNQASLNEPSMIKNLLVKMNEYGVHPELECFDLGMINYGNFLIKKGLAKGPYYFNLLFGNIAGMQPVETHFNAALDSINKDHWVGIAGIGNFQLPSCSWGIKNGLGVRIGIEDNIWFNKEQKELNTNVKLVKFAHRIMEQEGKNWMRPAEFGKLGFYNGYEFGIS